MSCLQYNIKNKISTIHFSMYLSLLKLFVYFVVDCSYICNFVHFNQKISPHSSKTQPLILIQIPCRTCSGLIVFFCCLSHISLASELNRCMNSVEHCKISSRASFATRIFGMTSFIILFIAARGKVSSSSAAAAPPWMELDGPNNSSSSSDDMVY